MAKRFVHKYVVKKDGTRELTLPKGAEILSAVNQFNDLCIYAMVSTEKELDTYALEVYGTGETIRHTEGYTFLNTVVMLGGNFVCHVFYKKL
jgi:hypothetical protein